MLEAIEPLLDDDGFLSVTNNQLEKGSHTLVVGTNWAITGTVINMRDVSISTNWQAANTGSISDCSVTWEFPSQRRYSNVAFYMAVTAQDTDSLNIKLQISRDGTTWTDLWDQDMSNGPIEYDQGFSNSVFKYIRFYLTNAQAETAQVNIYHFEVVK